MKALYRLYPNHWHQLVKTCVDARLPPFPSSLPLLPLSFPISYFVLLLTKRSKGVLKLSQCVQVEPSCQMTLCAVWADKSASGEINFY